jgi:HSP20 family protein
MVAPACDISETQNQFLLTFDAPGLKKEDIHIEVTGRQLTISGERKREEETQKANTYRLERSFGSFSRSFELPEGTNTDEVEATYDQGVLTVAIAKAEVEKTKKIQIGDSTSKSTLKSVMTNTKTNANSGARVG